MYLSSQTHALTPEGASYISTEALVEMSRLASIIESSEDAIISHDLDGTILTWNRGAAAIYGYASEEVIGRTVSLLLPEDRADEEDQILVRIRAGQRVQHFETVRIKKDGSPIRVSLTISPILEGNRVIGASHVARDISERRRLEGANAQLAAIVEYSEDAIISKDLTGTVQTWNAAAERVYGYSTTEAIGQNMRILLPTGREDEEEKILEKIRRGEEVDHFETVRRKKDGTQIDVSLRISPIRDRAGIIVGASHVARDVTRQKEFERQMQQTQRLESLGVLAGGIAHDFNNLLTGIMGNASLVSEKFPEEHEAQMLLRDLNAAAERAADLTRQMLAYSGKGQFVIEPVNISTLVEKIGTLIKASIPKTIEVRFELSGDVPLIQADRCQMQQLTMNMIVNGAEAIGDNRPGTVIVRTGAQDIDAEYIRAAFPATQLTPGEYAFMEVRDDGCGMDEETRARIFEPFFTTKFMGRGLGLAAVTGIVNAHKGVIRVDSTPGQGTCFKVLFPASERESVERRARRKAAHKGTILVVDDEEIVQRVAKSCLESSGYQVLLASNGKEAVELFRKLPASISLIILDLTMPLMSGEEAFQHLRSIRADVPVILSSGYSEAEATRRFPMESLTGFVQKPYGSRQLTERVNAVFNRLANGV
jgi:two-component system, cell cycle sensor histidine kinase and response regulator CckA